MTRLERLIKKKQNEIRELRKQRDLERKSKSIKKADRTGRPPISKEILLQIELEAYDRPLTDVALKYDVSLRTLYNHGISRAALNAKTR